MTIQEISELQYFKQRIIKLIKVKYYNEDLLTEFTDEFDRLYERFIYHDKEVSKKTI